MKRFVTCALMASLFLFWASEYVEALPPLGFTPVGDVISGNLEIIDGSAYIGAGSSVFRVDSDGSIMVTDLVHPEFGTPTNVTRVVEGPDGNLYVGANLGLADPFFVPNHAALFRLDKPTAPVMTWERDPDADEQPWIIGVDRSLRGVGNLGRFDSPAEFYPDGSIELLEHPAGATPVYVSQVSPSGYALGVSGVPGTLGSGVALWSPGGSFSFVSEGGTPDSLRDRLDGHGVNIGYNFGIPIIQHGQHPDLFLNVPDFGGSLHVLVSQSDFALIGTDAAGVRETESYFVFFPGIVPHEPAQAVQLFDVFPQLASFSFNRITDLAAADGRIYMTLSGDDGLYLFGARDPSVIPEPSTLMLLVVAAGASVCRCRSRGLGVRGGRGGEH